MMLAAYSTSAMPWVARSRGDILSARQSDVEEAGIFPNGSQMRYCAAGTARV